MKVFRILAIIMTSLVISYNIAYAESFDISGSGAAVVNGQSPKMYQSVFRMTISNESSIAKGTFLVYGPNSFVHAYVIPQNWSFLYSKDGSFHGEGQVKTVQGQPFNMTLDGTRMFATGMGSLWKVSADMEGNSTDMMLDYLVTGSDPMPTVDLSENATIIIPNGNSAIANKGFFVPLNLETMRGTVVTWQNEDNIGHVIQSQDGHGNLVSMFNSDILHTGDTFSYKFVKPGTYYYFCTIHPWRTGVVTVS